MHYTHCLWGISGSRFWPPERSWLQCQTCTKSHWFLHAVLASPFYVLSPIPISFKLRRHSHYHPIKVTVEAFLSPYLSPISQKLQTSCKLLWIVREKLFRLTRRNTASLHAHRSDTIAFLVAMTTFVIALFSFTFCPINILRHCLFSFFLFLYRRPEIPFVLHVVLVIPS